MDVNFSNVLEGTRQYFQGLPKASPGEEGDAAPHHDGDQSSATASSETVSLPLPGPAAASPPVTTTPQPPNGGSDPGMQPTPPPVLPQDPRPPSAPSLPPPEPPERPPSDPIEPEPHIIHKATVMQMAQQQSQQQKQQPFLNPSQDLERPCSANMISPPTHIIHKPSVLMSSVPNDNRNTTISVVQEDARIPSHFTVTSEGNTYAAPQNKPSQAPIQLKYSSHLPTPPQPTIHNSHYLSRIHGSSQPRNMTMLQNRQTSGISYGNTPYSGVDRTQVSNVNVSQKIPQTSQNVNSYSHPVYENNDSRHISATSDLYMKNPQSAKSSTPHLQRNVSEYQQYPQSAGYSYIHPSHVDHKSDVDKTTLNAINHRGYSQQIQHQKPRASSPAVKNSLSHSPVQSRQYAYNQKLVGQPSQHYHQSHFNSIKNINPQDSSRFKVSSGHSHEYTSRVPALKISNNTTVPTSAPNYQERVPSLTMDQRYMMISQNLHTSRHASHGSIGDSSHHYSRLPVQPHNKTSSEFQNHSTKLPPSQNQIYNNSNNLHQFQMINNSLEHSSSSNSSKQVVSGYHLQNSYQSSSVKQTYEVSPKSVSSRNLVSKQSLAVHQPRKTVTVTSLVNQMKISSRYDSSVLSSKPKKESPLDLSVKTVRTPADSTAQDDMENHNYDKREIVMQNNPSSNNRDIPGMSSHLIHPRQRYQHKPNNISSSHKVDFLPDFNTNPVEKSSPYQDPNSVYLKNKNYEQLYSKSNVSSMYKNKINTHIDSQSFPDKFDGTNRPVYTSNNYSRRIDSNVPKIDLTGTPDIDHSTNDRRNSQPIYVKDDPRKREAGYIQNNIPQKIARYDSWTYDRHGRADLSYARDIPVTHSNHYKSNGTNIPSVPSNKSYDNVLYKKSENIDPYNPKYNQHQLTSTHSEVYYRGYQKFNHTYQNHDFSGVDKTVPLKLESNSYNTHLSHISHSSTPADKRVLNKLRYNLESKNLNDSQKATDNSDDCIIIQSDDNSADFTDIKSKKMKSMTEFKNNSKPLSPLYSSEVEPYKIQVPRAVDSIKYDIDYTPKSIKIRDDLKSIDVNELSLNSSDRYSEIDMAAMLAARIRTKAELKGFTQGSNNFQANELNKVNNEINDSKVKIPQKVEHHRRRLFSKSDTLKGTENSKIEHTSVIRNSSDSVFDFPDSGSENDIPNINRNGDSKSETFPNSVEIIKIKSEKNSEEDPFWTETCDSFLEQLKTGKLKKTRRKKSSFLLTTEKSDLVSKDSILESIKIEKTAVVNIVDIIKTENSPLKKKIKEEIKEPVTQDSSTDSSDEDQPLINKKVKKENQNLLKTNVCEKVDESKWVVNPIKSENGCIAKRRTKNKYSPECKMKANKQPVVSSDDEKLSLKKIKQENNNRTDNVSDSNASDSEFDYMTVANRLRLRKSSSMSKCLENKLIKSPNKDISKSKDDTNKVKKAGFGDGSDFRPGWEEEVYRYKRSLRMPPSLINVSRPPHWPRISTSLPDLDPCPNSPAPSTSTEELYIHRSHDKSKHELDSDVESISSYINRKANYDSEASCSTVLSSTSKKLSKCENSSILDVLIQKCGKKDLKKNKLKNESDGPKVIPKSINSLELLATPNLNLEKNNKENTNTEYLYVGSFRQETVSNFRDAFITNTDGLLGATQEFSPVVLKSRTRTETRVMKQRATIKEVFGDERPASAPPTTYIDEPSQEKSTASIKFKTVPSKRIKKQISISREGLRSSRLLKRNDAKGRSLRIRKRNNFLKALSAKKAKNSLFSNPKVKKESSSPKNDESTTKNNEEENVLPIKKFKRLFPRRKLSSGFDYIRKKKKQIKKDDNNRKRSAFSRPSPESVHDIQREIKGWIINKSIGETVLHRAARLGYTDCVAYCLEKLDVPPSCRDNAGYTALHEACSRGHLDIARLLLQYGANVSEAAQGGIRPLHEACENGYVEIIRLLLSYGADPLLATYSGQTPISLSGGKAARLLQLHLCDVQGNMPQPWQFNGPCKLLDPIDNGYDPVSSPPAPPPSPPPPVSIEIITSTVSLPPLYRLKPSNHSNTESSNQTSDSDLWCLLQDLAALLQVKSRDALLKQIHCGPGPPKESLKELRMQEFLDRAQCQQLMSAGEKINIRASKIALVKYTEKVKQLLSVESVCIR